MTDHIKARILHGAFICASTDSHHYNLLKNDPIFRQDTALWLEQAGYRLCSTSSEAAYYAALSRPNSRDHAQALFHEFKEAYRASIFARSFLDILRSALDASIQFAPGELLRLPELYTAICTSESHKAKLRKIWTRLPKRNKTVDDYQMTRDILDELATQAYLVSVPGQEPYYRFTGKIEHLFDIIELADSLSATGIADTEYLDEPHDAPRPADAHDSPPPENDIAPDTDHG